MSYIDIAIIMCITAVVLIAWMLVSVYREKSRQLFSCDGAIIPASTRLVSTDGETFFTTRKAMVVGDRVVLSLRRGLETQMIGHHKPYIPGDS